MSKVILKRKHIKLTEEDFKSHLNENKWYHVNDITTITRYTSDVKSHPVFDGVELNQNNNIQKVTKFHRWQEFREQLQESDKSRIHYPNYKEIDNYWDFVGFKHKLINEYRAIREKEEDKHEVFIRGIISKQNSDTFAIIEYYLSCTYELENGIKYHDTLYIKLINSMYCRID